MGKRKAADSAAQKAEAGGDAACCPLFGVLALRFDMKEGKVAYLDQGIQRWRKQEEAQH